MWFVGQGGTGKRAVYEPDGAQRCKQVVCSRTWAVIIVVIFCCIIVAIAVIAAFARPGQKICQETATQSPLPSVVTEDPQAAVFPWKDIRLPKSVIPINYDIFMHPNLTTFHFSGTVNIELKILQSTSFVVLHLKNINISSPEMKFSQSSKKKVPIVRMLQYQKHEQLYIEFDRGLQPNKRYILTIKFKGILNDLMTGFYRSSYTTETGEKR